MTTNVYTYTYDGKRYCGILMHPTSLPSEYGIGDLGPGAYDFVDFLAAAGQSLWQVLPLGPTGFGDSPYQSFSSFAGQPLLISPEQLVRAGYLTQEDIRSIPKPAFDETRADYGKALAYKQPMFELAYERFLSRGGFTILGDYFSFYLKNKYWLDDYAFYMACREYHGNQCFTEWPEELKAPSSDVRHRWTIKLNRRIRYYMFLQYIFYSQWNELHAYASQKGIRIIGDIPIFTALDSADVWANPSYFRLDSKGYPTEGSGVPPDYFSADGQLWGNPLYDWDALRRDHFSWWIDRIRQQLTLVDILRIDHFRGFSACWAIPAGETTARNGHWTTVPGNEFFETLVRELGDDLPIIAEDLGTITEEVIALRDRFCLPGMKILQFAFEGDYENYFLPHQFKTANCVCYTGTHDNDTTAGWYRNTNDINKDKVRRYMSTDDGGVSWAFIRTCMASISKYAVFPMQDVLALGSDARMNIPGCSEGNWGWRCRRSDFHPDTARALYQMTRLFGRLEAQQL